MSEPDKISGWCLTYQGRLSTEIYTTSAEAAEAASEMLGIDYGIAEVEIRRVSPPPSSSQDAGLEK